MEYKKILHNKKVGIAGAGGLGSNCAMALARAGVGNIVVADFDFVEESNLNRQYFFIDQIGEEKVFALKHNISRVNLACYVSAHVLKVDESNIVSLFSDCDVIVEAFDNSSAKVMIIETVLEKLPAIPIVAGSGMAGWGDNNSLKTSKYDQLYVCGDQKKEVSLELPPLAPRVGIVANMQANQVLQILINSKNENINK